MKAGPLDEDRAEALKSAYIRRRGYWRPWNDVLLRRDPTLLEDYASYAAYPAETGPLSRRMIELVYVALDASATHLFTPGLKLHARLALEAGATVADLLDVMRLTIRQGADMAQVGEEILRDELDSGGASELPSDPTFESRAARLTARIGDDSEACAGLSAGEAALIRVALHATLTGFEERPLRYAIRDALEAEIEPEAIRQVLRMGAHLAVHSCALGLPLIEAALRANEDSERKEEN